MIQKLLNRKALTNDQFQRANKAVIEQESNHQKKVTDTVVEIVDKMEGDFQDVLRRNNQNPGRSGCKRQKIGKSFSGISPVPKKEAPFTTRICSSTVRLNLFLSMPSRLSLPGSY